MEPLPMFLLPLKTEEAQMQSLLLGVRELEGKRQGWREVVPWGEHWLGGASERWLGYMHSIGWVYPLFLSKMPYGSTSSRKLHGSPLMDRGLILKDWDMGQRTWLYQ